MNLFLRAKHWQIFILIFGSAMLFDIVTMFKDFFNLLFLGAVLGWLYSVAVGMQKMVPLTVKMKVTLFKVFFFIPVIYIILILFFTDVFSQSSGNAFFSPDASTVLAVILPVHLFCMFCMFYGLYFVAKTIKTVELQRSVTFSEFVKEFFLAWFFPIGIWILQPRINKMVKR